MYNSVTGAFGHDRNAGSIIESAETSILRKQNQQKLMNSSVQMKFPENSPYNVGRIKEFKPNQNRKEMILGAKKADFQGQLMNSSVRFTFDEKNNKVGYNNNAGGGGERDLIYNIQSKK